MPTHRERRVLPHSPQQLYELAADIERYPEFLPWCYAARIRRREGATLTADLAIGFRMFRERFTSRVVLSPDAPDGPRIDTRNADGPFHHLESWWIFRPHPDGCEVEFFVDFAFRSRLLQATIEMLFHEATRRMVAAFETRAAKLYGRPAVASSAVPAA